MGWDFVQGKTKKDVIADLTRKTPFRETLTKAIRGNVLWTVERWFKADGWEEPVIGCYLLGAEKGFGWGYKGMCESMHPYYYSCPAKFLDMAPVQCPEWREKVESFHAKE